MAVYVDDMEAEFRTMIMCHMIADTTQELLEMVDKIGVQRKWIQHPNTYKEHFDIAKSKRALAIRHGAIQITWREYAEKIDERKDKMPENDDEIVIKVLQTNTREGYCPKCGNGIWDSDKVKDLKNIYQCKRCDERVPLEELIPF